MSQALPKINQKHTVKVNEGSGVLIQPMSADYAYVLTAKHCLKTNVDDLNSAFIKPHKVYSFEGTEIPVIDVICHDTKDMAILIIASKPDYELMVNCDPLQVNDQLMLCGFPKDRREKDEEYSAFQYRFSHPSGDRLILSSEVPGVVHSNVVGFSGGGLFTLGLLGNPILLCAIETKMDGNVDNECHGNISAIPISEFEQLISDPSKSYLNEPLAPLLPLHLSSFKHLRQLIFTISNSWTLEYKLSFLKDRLREIAAEDIEVNLVPHEILKVFRQSLIVRNRPEHELQSKELWAALLELLTISILIDKPQIVNFSYVEKMINSRRLIFIGVNEPWQEHITEIFKAELNGLQQNGIIVVQTLSSQRSVSFSNERLRKLVNARNIAKPSSDLRSITNSRTNLSKVNSIVDLNALHAECIEIKESLYENHTDAVSFNDEKLAELRSILAEEYSVYLTVKVVPDDN